MTEEKLAMEIVNNLDTEIYDCEGSCVSIYDHMESACLAVIKAGRKESANDIDVLTKENAELKKDLQTAISANQQWLKRDTRLEEQIEKMENCWNCKFFKEKKYQACKDIKKNNTKCCAFYKWELAE